MLKQPLANLAPLFTNPNLRWPTLGVVACEALKLWFPNHSQQLDGTEKIIAFYLIGSAANSAPQPPKQ